MSKDTEGYEGVWRTIRGKRVFIRKNEELEDAMKRSGKFGDMTKEWREEYKNKLEKKLSKYGVKCKIVGPDEKTYRNDCIVKISIRDKDNNEIESIPFNSEEQANRWLSTYNDTIAETIINNKYNKEYDFVFDKDIPSKYKDIYKKIKNELKSKK